VSKLPDAAHPTLAALEEGLDDVRRSPVDGGPLRLIVRRPSTGVREVLQEGRLDPAEGLVGDNWRSRGGDDPDPSTQINVMNARVIALLAGPVERWPLAGDQLFVDLDLSAENLPPGTRLAIGSSVIEVSAEPHTGCGKFAARFGVDAAKFVNSRTGVRLNLRGINARVVQAGAIRVGDAVRKLAAAAAADRG
jgi:hypothetical protein